MSFQLLKTEERIGELSMFGHSCLILMLFALALLIVRPEIGIHPQPTVSVLYLISPL